MIRLTKIAVNSFNHFRALSTVPFQYTDLFQLGKSDTPYRKLTDKYVKTIEGPEGRKFLKVEPEALRLLTAQAMVDIAHLLRPAHLQQLRNILDDPEASDNDRFVALELLKNASIAAAMILPGCQDTGTAIAMGKRGQNVLTDGQDEKHISNGVYDTYTGTNLRYSQVAPLNMFDEQNTKTNLPAQIDIYAVDGNEYNFLYIAKGGGSANKTFLFQQTRAVLNPKALETFLEEKIKTIGTSACPPYHLAIVIGGLSAELNLKTVKMASTKYYDTLPTTGDATGRAFRDLEWEDRILKMTHKLGIGAQFGGKYFCHDVRVVRLPRHGASCPVGVGVSCSADRQVKGKITAEGVFIEQLERDVGKYIPEVTLDNIDNVREKKAKKRKQAASEGAGAEAVDTDRVVPIDLNQPMDDIRRLLSEQCPVRTRVALTGTLVVARDIAHAKIMDRIEAEGPAGMPQYLKDHIVYYAGPAKTPPPSTDAATGAVHTYASGSFGPTTAGRMDAYVGGFMAQGGSFITLAKGNRSKAVTRACQKYGGFYLGSIGGPAAILAQNCIKKIEVLEYEELGMEAVWRIEVEDFPAFVVVDDKGNDFFSEWMG